MKSDLLDLLVIERLKQMCRNENRRLNRTDSDWSRDVVGNGEARLPARVAFGQPSSNAFASAGERDGSGFSPMQQPGTVRQPEQHDAANENPRQHERVGPAAGGDSDLVSATRGILDSQQKRKADGHQQD